MVSGPLSFFAAVVSSVALVAAAPAAPAQATPVQFSIGSFNVHDPDSSGCGPWTSRGPWVAKQIIDRKLNIVGVQEVFDGQDRETLIKYVNYAASGQWSTTSPYAMTLPMDDTNGYDDRILYDTRRVTLKGTWGMKFRNQAPGDNPRGRWAMWSLFTHNTNGRPFLVFNTHLAPGYDTYDELQWKELLAQIQTFRARYTSAYNATIPVFSIGDYNTTKFEAAAKDMLPAMRNAGVGDILGQQYRTYTTYAARVVSGSGYAYVNSFNHCDPDTRHYSVAAGRNGNSSDYIFASNYLKGPGGGSIPFFEYVGWGTPPFLRLPIPSDHFLRTATFELP